MMDTQRLIALIVFSFSALLLWDAWQKHSAPRLPHATATTIPSSPSSATPPSASTAAPASPGAPVNAEAAPSQVPISAPPAAAAAPVVVHTDLFDVEISPAGGDIHRVTMKQVHSALDRSQPLTLMEPNDKHYFITQSGLILSGHPGLPNHRTLYQAEQSTYTLPAGKDSIEVRLRAPAADGAEVVKRLTFHRNSYVIDVAYDVTNRTDKALAPWAYFQFVRDANPPSQEAAQTSAFAGVTTFTGPALYTEESKFTKIDFKDVDKGKPIPVAKAKDGWIGIVQHYFVSAWLPKPGVEREFYSERIDSLYRTGVKLPVGSIAPGATASIDVPAYIGPQETERLENIAPGLNLVVDYGWLYVLAAPLFWFLKWIHGIVGNWGWAIIFLTIIIKLVFYPLNAKAGRSMAQMKVLAPKMEKLKQLYGDDRQKLNQAMMELYRTEKINPLGGCLPIVVQIPVFIALYWVLLSSIELRHAPWLGWIHDLSAPDPYFILPVIYAVSMFVQTRLNPQPADPVQARVMLIMPIMFSVFFLFFPAGLVLYWVVQNLLSILQQWHINRTLAREAKARARR